MKSITKTLCCIGFTILLIGAALLIVFVTRGGAEANTSTTLGTCSNGTADDDTLRVLTLNTFLIPCLPGSQTKCQDENDREVRVSEITDWFNDRDDDDVVLFQEVFSFHDELRGGMSDAGFCHSIMQEETIGSGLAVFSKYPIDEHDYAGWLEFGIGNDVSETPASNLEAASKGILYAKVMKDGKPIHLFNLHANSDSYGDNHDIRVKQFNAAGEFMNTKEIPSNELVVLGGDFNEDRECRLRTCEGEAKCEGQEYYNKMIDILSVGTPVTTSNQTYTYDSKNNNLLKGLYSGEEDCDEYQYTLDYIFFSENHTIPSSSTCEVLTPLASDGTDISDHFPLACTFSGLGK